MLLTSRDVSLNVCKFGLSLATFGPIGYFDQQTDVDTAMLHVPGILKPQMLVDLALALRATCVPW